MAKFVKDVKTNRWVIIAPARINRAHDNTPFGAPTCPFCPGKEDLNKELFRVGNPWRIRVITNKYPITDCHEVIIHSPDHEKNGDMGLILTTYRTRYNLHKNNGSVMIFNNHDIHAGASLKHPHSQIVVVPKDIVLDTITREPVQNEVMRTRHFVTYCPDFSQWPYEIWIAPLVENTTFGQITDAEIDDLAPLMNKILEFMHKKFSGDDEVPYNYYIYHDTNWYLRIIPRLVHRAGFELGTGLSVNIVDPATAAEEYKAGLLAHSQ